MRRALPVTLALVVALASGCSDLEESVARDVVLGDGGYALVKITVPASHEADIDITFDGGAQGESFAVLYEPDEPPFHTGWFDMSPWMDECLRDRQSSGCLGVHSQKAGKFLGVGRREIGPPRVRDRDDCSDKNDDGCVRYYAIVAGERGADRTAKVTVRTVNKVAVDPATIHQIR